MVSNEGQAGNLTRLQRWQSLKSLNILFNMGLRGATLVFRFALSFYIVKFLGLEAAGLYGLALGIVSAAPAILGWGLNYFLARDVVGKTTGVAGVYMKTRLLVTTIALVIATVLCLVASYVTDHPIAPLYIMVMLLVWLETWSCDIHVPLIAQEMSSKANVLFFVRTSLWIPPVIGLGLLFESFRTIETVLIAWSTGYIFMFATLAWFVRTWPIMRIIRTPMRFSWIKRRMRRSWMIYISDVSNVGLVYADRYIVSLLLGLTLTGVYTFYWSLANALQTLISTAVLQVAIPMLFKAYSSGSMEQWRKVMVRQFIRTGAFAAFLGLAIFVSGNILVHYMNMPELGEHQGMFALLLLASVIRSCSDLMGMGLNSLRKDGHYVFVNMFSVVLSVSLAFTMISTFGFIGAGIATICTSLIVASTSAVMLWRASREVRAAV